MNNFSFNTNLNLGSCFCIDPYNCYLLFSEGLVVGFTVDVTTNVVGGGGSGGALVFAEDADKLGVTAGAFVIKKQHVSKEKY